jgi:hypothetical protein
VVQIANVTSSNSPLAANRTAVTKLLNTARWLRSSFVIAAPACPGFYSGLGDCLVVALQVCIRPLRTAHPKWEMASIEPSGIALVLVGL